MATFNVKKGGKFNIDKGIKSVQIGLGWKIGDTKGKTFDVDANAFGCVLDFSQNPKFFGDGSHALTYANQDLKKGPNKSFFTADESMKHTGDNRTGAASGDAEQMIIDFTKIPPEITEVSIFITIHEAKQRKQVFGQISNSYIRIIDQDSQQELCRYDLQKEFDQAISIQVGSLTLDNGNWTFQAVGAGSPSDDLGDILGKLS